jgi:hypothetical protein
MMVVDLMTDLVRTMDENLENWIRAVFLKELGPDFYGKDDREIAEEAGKRGYVLARDPEGPYFNLKYAILDKDHNTISKFVFKYKTE